MFTNGCGTSSPTTATDGFMTRKEIDFCDWHGYMFHIPPNNSFATISLPAASTVRTMLFSSREI
jgi:hypothetical protein